MKLTTLTHVSVDGVMQADTPPPLSLLPVSLPRDRAGR